MNLKIHKDKTNAQKIKAKHCLIYKILYIKVFFEDPFKIITTNFSAALTLIARTLQINV